jgi:hypothetical protein
MKGASVGWSSKKNNVLKRLMRRDYGRVLTESEFRALDPRIQAEMQKDAYEQAFPGKAKRTPEEFLSVAGRQRRAKERRRKSLSRSGRRLSRFQEPHKDARDGYPGPEQAKKDFIAAYTRRYPDKSVRKSAMRRDLNRSDKELVDPYKAYNLWKNEPWKYDLRGIDTAQSDDEYLHEENKRLDRELTPVNIAILSGASAKKRRGRGRSKRRSHSKSRSHSKKGGRRSRSRSASAKSSRRHRSRK